jgi:hypothetical protein
MKIKTDEKSPELAALQLEEGKLTALQGDRAKEQNELDRMTQIYLSRKQSNKASRLEDEADQLINGTNMVTSAADSDLKTIEAIEHKIAVLDLAINKQRSKLDTARGRFSLHLCQINKDRYVEIERRIARAVKELAEANQAEVEFFNELRDAGANSISFRPMRITQVGIASDSQSVARFHEREVKQYCPEAAA